MPEELQHIINSDDSDRDPNFDVDGASLSSGDSGGDNRSPKIRKTMLGISSESNLIVDTSDSEDGTNIPLTKRGRPRIRGLKGDSRKNSKARKIAHNSGRLPFVSSLVDIKDKKTARKRSRSGENSHFHQISLVYNIEIEDQRTTLCKTCFMKVFGRADDLLKQRFRRNASAHLVLCSWMPEG
ncbi:hypothetical protein PR048_005797 [Dryococelus australis]|uniref:Uncharacterized protein n=1 Tax=Dryococelus australis TaxID=614101 RepID=A0ABQ9IA54_9NEOP|nr:hypothetical protein PR048_005797 [Dryococelus australis]